MSKGINDWIQAQKRKHFVSDALPLSKTECYDHAENIQQIMNEADFKELPEWRIKKLKELEERLINLSGRS